MLLTPAEWKRWVCNFLYNLYIHNKINNIVTLWLIYISSSKNGALKLNRTYLGYTTTYQSFHFQLILKQLSDGASKTKDGNEFQKVALYKNLTFTFLPTVLSTDVDGQCDKLVTNDRHQFIILTVHLSWQHPRWSTWQL